MHHTISQYLYATILTKLITKLAESLIDSLMYLNVVGDTASIFLGGGVTTRVSAEG